ncbi:MAG: HU family DNA-binding protein [Treponema sp.]|jgi:integration host factor subunit beta|nr:HU family DNA-binding protein [Treponema sp.]
MSKLKFTRSRIWEILISGACLEPTQARVFTNQIITALAAAIATGRVIELRGLGTIETRERKAHKAHNPRTLAPVDVPARRYVFFTPGKRLNAALPEPAGSGS